MKRENVNKTTYLCPQAAAGVCGLGHEHIAAI